MRKLFENAKVAIIESADLSHDEAVRISKILDESGSGYGLYEDGSSITKEDLISNEYTHIASNNIYFELYPFAQENMIPVVTAEFFYKAQELQKTPPIRPFSPDPKHVLKDIHVCVGGLPVSDKEAIYGGVRALGGSFSETLNKFVTHLISTDSEEDCCIAVYSIEECNIKVVLPNWIDDCLKLRKRLDETPYLLEEGGSVQEQVEKLNEIDIVTKDTDLIVAQDKFLNNKRFFIGSDLELTTRSQDLIVSLIENSGGVVNDSLSDAQYYVGKFRDGDEYLSASRSGLYVGNLNWIYWMVEHQKYISPYNKLLHYPYVRHGMPQMKKFIIASTNYSGDVRFYIQKLVEALGAEFTTSLKQKNTHLITATPVGQKYNAAKKWGNIAIVNHLWLEETYSNWILQTVSHPRYSHFPRNLNMADIVGQTSLDIQVLRQFYDDGSADNFTNVIEDSEGEDAFAIDINPITKKVLTPKKPSDVNISSLERATKTPSKIDKENPQLDENTEAAIVKEVETPAAKVGKVSKSAASSTPVSVIRPSSGRKAKDKAALKLHEDMEQLNYFQKQHRLKDVPMLPEEIEERKRKRALELAEKEEREKRHSSHASEDEDKDEAEVEEAEEKQAPKAKKAKKSVTPQPSMPYNITAIATGWELNFGRADTQILNNLGITLHKEFKKDINAIIAPKFMRTEKFLVGLSYKLDYILSPIFLEEVLTKFKSDPNALNKLPDVQKFGIDKINPKSVEDLTSVKLSTLLDKSKRRINSYDRIFHDLSFNITPKIPGGATIVQKILKAHGANQVNVLKTIKDMKNSRALAICPDESFILISNEKGFNDRFQTILKDEDLHGKVIEWNWVINSIFHMEINNKKNVIYKK